MIQRVLKTPNLDIAEAVREANQAAGQPTVKTVPVNQLLTPVVEINDPKDPAREDRTDLQLAYSVRLPSADDTLRVEALVDGVKVKAKEQRLVDKGDTRAGILHLEIPRQDSKVSVIAYNTNGASVPASVQVKWTGAGTEPKLTLYVLAIGITNYKDARQNLHFAAKDAEDFVALAKAQEGGLYEKVILPPGMRAYGTEMQQERQLSRVSTGSWARLPKRPTSPWCFFPVTELPRRTGITVSCLTIMMTITPCPPQSLTRSCRIT